jgi:hypothetical protein
VECCRDLESFSLDVNGFELGRSDIEAIESLPRFRFLDLIRCKVADGAVSALSRCRKLKHLAIEWSDGLNDVLRAIGANLSSLELWGAKDLVYLKLVEK